MCGISGFIHLTDDVIISEEDLRKMSGRLRHRGPDNEGICYTSQFGFGHNRLSIIDLNERSNQPLRNGPLTITFNGEIYNYLELRRELIGLGYAFSTISDTEVILVAFQHWGVECFARLNGIFAFAIFDSRNKTTYIVRDRMGVKPVYIYHNKKFVLFASEIKAITACSFIPRKINYSSMNEFMLFGYTVTENTIYNDILKVKPGHYYRISEKGVDSFNYWDLPVTTNYSINEDEASEQLKYHLEKSVKRQLVSDQPVGIFLSGGVDSSAVTAFAAKHYGKRLNTYSVEFDFNKSTHSELNKARKIAQMFNTKHHELQIEVTNLPETVEFLARQHDEPFFDAANIPLYLLTKTLKDNLKVVLQGDGGDELFGGYRYYNYLHYYSYFHFLSTGYRFIDPALRIARPEIAERLRRFSEALLQKNTAQKLLNIGIWDLPNKDNNEVLDEATRQQILKTDASIAFQNITRKYKGSSLTQLMQYVDLKITLPFNYLEKVDKPTMANAVEVRVPFLDNELVEYTLSLPEEIRLKKGKQKYLLKKALRGTVPDDILDGKKQGFRVPVSQWMKKGLFDFYMDTLNEPQIRQSGLFDVERIKQMMMDHRTGKSDHGSLLWKTMILALWYKHYDPQL